MIKNKTEIRVRYADTDKMQFVYNGKYFEYFEVGRAELLRSYGLAYSEIEKLGYQLPLTEAGIKYKLAARYDDIVSIEARIEKLDGAKIRIDYEIFNKETDEKLVTGFTEHVFMIVSTGKATRPPKFFIDKFGGYFEN